MTVMYNNNMNVLNIFLNRMYGDYYKLYKKIVEYVNTEIPRDEKINDSNYPTYKDLDISKKYSFNITNVPNNLIKLAKLYGVKEFL